MRPRPGRRHHRQPERRPGMQPTSSRPSGRAFSQTYRIYYADTDAGGIVYHARYLEFAERSRAEMLRQVGHPLVGPAGEQFVARAAALSWQKPARLDDLITCETSVMHARGASIRIRHAFFRGTRRWSRSRSTSSTSTARCGRRGCPTRCARGWRRSWKAPNPAPNARSRPCRRGCGRGTSRSAPPGSRIAGPGSG
ncbi:MAG: YbgC/FadM family acyl-CoA thioesterase [Paracoccus aminovorans]|nr:YbgC/FadM family acyl-CoA thioesterase [Paracoccus aminovorans]